MSFQIIAARHPHDKDFPRAHGVNVRLSLLNGTFYSHQPYPFHQEYAGNEYIPLHDRAPNTHTGTNQLRTVIDDHVSMLFGDGHFPEVDTANAVVRKATKDFIKDVGLVERMREAARLGSVGSVGIHLKVLQRPGGPARMFVDVHTTAYLTPEYDEYRGAHYITFENGVAQIVRAPLDVLGGWISQAWVYIGGFAAPVDKLANSANIPTAGWARRLLQMP